MKDAKPDEGIPIGIVRSEVSGLEPKPQSLQQKMGYWDRLLYGKMLRAIPGVTGFRTQENKFGIYVKDAMTISLLQGILKDHIEA